MICVLAQAAITKYHRWDDFNNRNLFSHSSEVWKSEIRVPAWLGSGESSLPGLQMAAFFLCPHMSPPIVEREINLSSSPKATNPITLEPHPYNLI